MADLCRMCHREKRMISTPDRHTCSILCQKLRLGQITIDEFFLQWGDNPPEMPALASCPSDCSWRGAHGATGVLPPGHCRVRYKNGAVLAHDGLPFPRYEHDKWVVLNGEWMLKSDVPERT